MNAHGYLRHLVNFRQRGAALAATVVFLTAILPPGSLAVEPGQAGFDPTVPSIPAANSPDAAPTPVPLSTPAEASTDSTPKPLPIPQPIPLGATTQGAAETAGTASTAGDTSSSSTTALASATPLNKTKDGSTGSAKGKTYAQATSTDPQKTVEEMTKAIENDPTDAGAFDQRGAAYNKLEQFDNAMHDLNMAIKMDPTMATAYANRGYTYYKLAKYQEALKDLNEAIRLNPNLPQAYTYRGNVYSKLEQYQKSIQDINKGLALQQTAKDSGGLLSRSRTQYLIGNYKVALADASAAIARDPHNPVGYDNRGLCEHQLKSFQAAISDYNKALSLRPNEAKYICHRAISYAEMGQHEKAIPDYDEAIRLKPNFALAYYDRAISHYLMHHYEQATKDMQQAVKYDPHYALALYELPLDPTKGAKDVRKISDPEEYFYRATTRILMIKNQTALADLKKYLEMTNWRGSLALTAVILSYLGFTLNHQTAEAQQVLTAASQRVDTTQWPYSVIRYLKHEIKADELLAEAGSDTDKLTDAHAYIGIDMMLSGGDHKQAVQRMMWAKQQGNGNLVSYTLAVREIEKIQFKKHRETERT